MLMLTRFSWAECLNVIWRISLPMRCTRKLGRLDRSALVVLLAIGDEIRSQTQKLFVTRKKWGRLKVGQSTELASIFQSPERCASVPYRLLAALVQLLAVLHASARLPMNLKGACMHNAIR